MICTARHSMLTCDSRTYGGFTRSLAAGVRPHSWNSSTPWGYSPEQTFMASAISSLTMLMTNSPVAFTFARVSLDGMRKPFEKQTVGGSAQIALKKLNGAKLRTPSADKVEMNAIGRGTTDPMSSL